MPITTQDMAAAPVAPATVSVRIVRPVYIRGQPLDVGATAELAPSFAAELCSAGKAERVEAASAATPPAEAPPAEAPPAEARATKAKA